MKQRSVEVMDVHFVFDRIIAILIRRTVAEATLDTATSQPHGEPLRVVVSAVTSLHSWRAAEFPAPNNERVL